MIVVAIVGILASVAIPAYSDYTVRAKVTEAVTAAGAIKTSVADYYYANGELPTSNEAAGVGTNTSYETDVIDEITVLSGSENDGTAGTISVKFKAFGGNVNGGDTLVFIPDTTENSLQWSCSASKGGGQLADEYAPANCRESGGA
jgi:type IV pilus assembly protein PilA